MKGEKQLKSWQSTPTPNLVRHVPSGTYYLRARFGGPPRRESLGTDKYRLALFKLGPRLAELRGTERRRDDAPTTIAAALVLVRQEIEADPSLKSATRKSYIEYIEALAPGGPAAAPQTALDRLSSRELEVWWNCTAKAYSAQRANHLLAMLRRGLKKASKLGSMTRDPAEELTPMNIPRTRLDLLTAEQFRSVVLSIRSKRHRHSEEAANWVEFMAYSGMRPGEIVAVRWAHIGTDSILVTGGDEGTKNRDFRFVPIIPPMRDLIDRILINRAPCDSPRRALTQLATTLEGPVFTIKKPHEALKNACRRLGLPHQRIYDLRHLFASMCCESGVDVPTFAKWLGHRDGGTLAMRTYVHPADEHSQRSAAKVQF